MQKKPTLRKGPASSYEAPNEVIREFGNGKGDGGLLSLRNMDDGSMVVEVYQVTGPVTIHTPGIVMTPAARGYLATAAAEARAASVDTETQEALDRVARIGITPKDTNFEADFNAVNAAMLRLNNEDLFQLKLNLDARLDRS